MELDEGLGDDELDPVNPEEVIVALPECENIEEVNKILSFLPRLIL